MDEVQDETVEEKENITVEDEVINEEVAQLEEAKAQTEIFSNYLERDYPEPLGKVRFYHPTLDIESELELKYVEEFNRLLLNSDLPTVRRMEKILEDRDAWTEEDDKKVESLVSKINNRQITRAQIRRQLETRKKGVKKLLKDIKRISDEILELQMELAILTARKSTLFEGTIEKRAERSGLFLKVVRCVKRKDGTPVWNSVEELGQDDAKLVKPMIFDAIRFWQGVDTPLSEDLLALISGN